jgi:transposase
MDILNLDELEVIEAKENEHDYLIKVESFPPFYCTYKGCYGTDFIKFGSKEVLYMDLPIHAKRVGVLFKQQRYKCKECERTFRYTPYCFDYKRYMTVRLRNYIEEQSIKSNKTFVSIAEEIGLVEKTVRDIFSDYVAKLEKEHEFETPRFLGIDEIHILKRPRGILTNIKERTILDLLNNRNKSTIEKYLSNLPNKNNVECVSIDMWKPYKDAVEKHLPNSKIIVDKFHVVRMANNALDRVRKDLKSSLSRKERLTLKNDRFILLKRNSELKPQERIFLDYWTNNFNNLGTAYRLKEDFFDIYNSPNEYIAKQKYENWLSHITEDVLYAYEPLITAMQNWNTEIFNYFSHRVTNAYTESLNSLIRVINRMGRGYSFDVLRAKILFSKGIRKVKRPKYSISTFEKVMDMPPNLMVSENLNIDYGADITTIIQKIEEGAL